MLSIKSPSNNYPSLISDGKPNEALNKEFGLNITLTNPAPVNHPWMVEDPTIDNLDEE